MQQNGSHRSGWKRKREKGAVLPTNKNEKENLFHWLINLNLKTSLFVIAQYISLTVNNNGFQNQNGITTV